MKDADLQICITVIPDEAVAYGAAVLAAIIHGGATNEMEKMKLMEETPLTLGVAISWDGDKIMEPVVLRNTSIPVARCQVFQTAEDYQTTIRFPIFRPMRTMKLVN